MVLSAQLNSVAVNIGSSPYAPRLPYCRPDGRLHSGLAHGHLSGVARLFERWLTDLAAVPLHQSKTVPPPDPMHVGDWSVWHGTEHHQRFVSAIHTTAGTRLSLFRPALPAETVTPNNTPVQLAQLRTQLKGLDRQDPLFPALQALQSAAPVDHLQYNVCSGTGNRRITTTNTAVVVALPLDDLANCAEHAAADASCLQSIIAAARAANWGATALLGLQMAERTLADSSKRLFVTLTATRINPTDILASPQVTILLHQPDALAVPPVVPSAACWQDADIYHTTVFATDPSVPVMTCTLQRRSHPIAELRYSIDPVESIFGGTPIGPSTRNVLNAVATDMPHVITTSSQPLLAADEIAAAVQSITTMPHAPALFAQLPGFPHQSSFSAALHAWARTVPHEAWLHCIAHFAQPRYAHNADRFREDFLTMQRAHRVRQQQ